MAGLKSGSSLGCWLAAGAGVLAACFALAWWQARRDNIELEASRLRLTRELAEVSHEARQAGDTAAEYRQAAHSLDSQLGAAKSRQTATELKAEELARELGTREQRIAALLAEIEGLRQGRTSAATTVATGEDRQARARIAELEGQLVALLTRALAEPAPASAGVKTGWRVLRVGPRDSFVITDYGVEAGAAAGQVLVVARGTKALARVQITDVRGDFSVAQVLTASAKAQLQTGDFVLLED